MDVKVRLHRNPLTENIDQDQKIGLLYQTGNTNSRFIINGNLKFEVNKAGSFEFDILPAHPAYSILKRYTQYVSVTINEESTIWDKPDVDEGTDIDMDTGEAHDYIDLADAGLVFYGRILSISMDFSRVKHVVCEGLMANLVDAPMFNDMADDIGKLLWLETATLYQEVIVDGKVIGVVKVEQEEEEEEDEDKEDVVEGDGDSRSWELYRISGDANIMWEKAGNAYKHIMNRRDIRFVSANISSENIDDIDVYSGQSVGDFITSELVGVYGGFLKMKYELHSDLTVYGLLSWEPDPTMPGYRKTESMQKIEFGKNLLDLSAEFSDEEAVNGVCVAWTDKEDKKQWSVIIKKIDDDQVHARNQILAPTVHGRRNAGIEFIEVPGVATPKLAYRYANAYVRKFCKHDFANEKFDSYTVKAIDRHYIDPSVQQIKLYDLVNLVSEPHDVNESLTCTSIEYSIDNPIVRSYKLEVFKPKPSSDEKVLSKQIGRKIRQKEDFKSGDLSYEVKLT